MVKKIFHSGSCTALIEGKQVFYDIADSQYKVLNSLKFRYLGKGKILTCNGKKQGTLDKIFFENDKEFNKYIEKENSVHFWKKISPYKFSCGFIDLDL